MDLSVVIVNWNGGRHLRRLLDSLKSFRGEIHQVWIVDNASTDSSLEGVDEGPPFEVLALSENRGFAGGANEGISRSRSRFVLLLNPDVEVSGESLFRLYREMEARSGAAIVCGSLKDPEGREQSRFQFRPFPTWRSVLSDALFLDELLQWLGRSGDEAPGPPDASGPEPTRRLTGLQPAAAAWLLRREAWEELEGFDPQFHPAWFEDVDFCRRLQDTRWEILHLPRVQIVHRGGHTVELLGRSEFLRIFYGNLLKYLKKHHPRSYPFLWLPVRCGVWMRRALLT